MKMLITGATGFVGHSLIDSLIDTNCAVTALVRERSLLLPKEVMQVAGGDLSAWSVKDSLFNSKVKQVLQDINVVIHLAARVHIMSNDSSDPLTEFRRVNTGTTLNLAKQAATSGVKRFIFISSVKVNGEITGSDVYSHPSPFPEGDSVKGCFSEDDEFIPTDIYGLSKYEAEQGLLKLAQETDMEVVIIRPPLVYGLGVRANFASMIKWINKVVPLPFGAIHNQRSLVALDNLVSFIIHCIDHPKAANEIFLISDGEDVSTTELLKKVAKAFGKNACLLPVPVSWMQFVAKLVGKEDVANRLFGSLQVDSSKARELLGWKPVITMDEQLKKMADAD